MKCLLLLFPIASLAADAAKGGKDGKKKPGKDGGRKPTPGEDVWLLFYAFVFLLENLY